MNAYLNTYVIRLPSLSSSPDLALASRSSICRIFFLRFFTFFPMSTSPTSSHFATSAAEVTDKHTHINTVMCSG